ncbi:MAG: hypothetical protein LUE64_03070 [Candidatus Gastranaerophilales bacterium]|nr:hypothetical protein [Candidatus Gastranaerophilales bacterium]
MGLVSFFRDLFNALSDTENSIKLDFKFTQKEIYEIMAVSKKENIKYFETLSKMPNLKYFDISYLLSQVDLDEEKIELIEEAQKIYNEKEFIANGQTESDFVFRVAANLEYLNKENIELFKELVKCKNELYDFKYALQNPLKYMAKNETELKFAFVTVYDKNN